MFNFSFDKRILYVIIGVMVFRTLYQYSTVDGALLNLLLTVPGVLIAITFHEFAHAFVAYKLGDDTAKQEGRLTLNPLAHLDPIGSLLLLVAGFGWGKPVNVNPRNYNRKMSMEKADALVSVAGPIMNFLLAIIFTIIVCLTMKLTNTSIIYLQNTMALTAGNQMTHAIIQTLLYVVAINVGLGVFNLIPLPPLDGSKVLKPFLPFKAKEFFENNEMIFYIVFILIWATGIASIIISPIINVINTGLLNIGLSVFGLI